MIVISQRGKNKNPEICNGIFINNYPENNRLPLPSNNPFRQTVPGNSNYADVSRNGEKICILRNSICRPINMIEFNRVLKEGNAIKRFYPGATLEEGHPDTLIIMTGTNGITKKKNQSARE